jgi:hypothetical protein
LTKKPDRENGNIYSPVLTALAGTSELSTFDPGLSVRVLAVLTKDVQPSWVMQSTS